MTVWLARHLPARAREGVFLGWSDPPLREDAADWAAAAADRIGEAEAVWSSDLCRARQSARPLARALGVPIEVDPRLRELDFGRWDGLSWNEVAAEDPELAHTWIKDWRRVRSPEGESYAELRERVESWWQEQRAEAGPLVVVAHGGSLRALAEVLLGERAPQETMERGALMRVEIPG